MGLRYVNYARYASAAASGSTTAACVEPAWGAPAAVAAEPRPAAPGWAAPRDGAPSAAEGSAATRDAARDRRGGSGARPGALATFWLLYESRDQRLSLFETRDGHLAAVDPARLV